MRNGTVALLSVWLSVWSASGAWATNDGRADPDLLIDGLDTCPSVDLAQRACHDDPVVWADRYTGFYFESREPQFGATPNGSYACESRAKKARYWSTDPRRSMEGHPGRTFPFDPIYLGS